MSVAVEHVGPVTQLTLDRQDAANAIDIATALSIADAIDTFSADENARVLIVTGAVSTSDLSPLPPGLGVAAADHTRRAPDVEAAHPAGRRLQAREIRPARTARVGDLAARREDGVSRR
jgi:hypothetical protein